MSKRCQNEVQRAVLAEREACAKAMCILCKHDIPLHGDYHVIAEIIDENMEVLGQRVKKINPPVAIACHGKAIRDRSSL